MHFRQAILKIDNKTYLLAPGRSNSFDEIYVDFQNQPESGGERWSVFLHPKQDVTIQRLEIQFDLPLPPGARFFANGFQSWSESRLYGLNETIPRLRAFAGKHMGLYGDEHIPGIPYGRGYLHSWTYTYITVDGGRLTADGSEMLFMGSLNESTGFTLFLYDRPNAIFTVRKDMEGLQLAHSFPALDFWIGQGREPELFDRYFQILGTPRFADPPALGWTSWYRHFNRISEEILLQNLDGVANSGLPFQYFQVDDGWQAAVGDWLTVKSGFPNGMGALAQTIRARGLSPGIWLAPFVAAKNSDLVRKHPDWLLKNAKGQPLKAGWNPMWGGWYYALDFYNNEVRNHLGGVFHAILDRWGYEMVKLDFLFAVSIAPPPGKTRGQVMHEAMEFLRKLVGTKKILACGVPLGAAFGLADYCRIGGDIHLAWEHRLLAFLRFRERVSSIASLRSTLGRWQLNGRAFHNDPDVFVLRNERQALSLQQQHTVLTINALLGNLLFSSDDFSQYSPEQMSEVQAALEIRGSRILSVAELQQDFYRIEFENEGARYQALCNLNSRSVELPSTATKSVISLQAFESMVLKI